MNWFPSLKNPRGPSLKQLEPFKLTLSGTEIKFALPKSNYPIMQDTFTDRVINLYDSEIFKFHEDEICPVPILGCGIRHFQFYGLPVIHGGFASATVHMFALRQDAFASLFRPSRAQKAIERFIYTRDGPARNVFKYRCRVNWQVPSINGCQWVTYKNVCDYIRRAYWHLPITDEHMFVVGFYFHRHHKRAQLDNYYDFFEHSILNTFAIKRSSDSKRLMTDIENAYPNDKYANQLPPLIWDEEPVEDEYAIRDKVFFQFNPNNEYYKLPNGEIDLARQNRENELIAQEVKRIISEQKDSLNKKINLTLESHVKF